MDAEQNETVNSQSEASRSIYVGYDLDEYKALPTNWIDTMLRSTVRGTVLDICGVNFALSVFGIVQSRSMMRMMCHGLSTAIDEAAKPHASVPFLIISEMHQEYRNMFLPGPSVRSSTRDPVDDLFKRWRLKAHDSALETVRSKWARTDFSPNGIYKGYIEKDQVRIGLYATEVQTYVGLFTAYDTLITASLDRIYGAPKNEADGSRVSYYGDLIREKFTDGHALKLWCGREMAMFRLVRNSLVHDAGRSSSKLERQQNHPVVLNGFIILHPMDVDRLYHFISQASVQAMKCFLALES